MPFIVLARSDIPNEVLQVTDLWPNRSQYNPTLDPPAVGPRYLAQPVLAAPSLRTVGAVVTFAVPSSGLQAYLLANVQAGGAGGPALSLSQASSMASALVAAAHSGAPLTLAAINAILAGVLAGTVLTAGGSLSTGAVKDILRILGGTGYTVPGNTQIQAAGPIFAPQSSPASWNAANFAVYQDILPTDNSFFLSLASGKIAGFKSASFQYRGVTAPAVSVYDDAGNPL